jgi:hypothetical protein
MARESESGSRQLIALIACVAWMACVQSAHGDFIYSTESRSVSAGTHGPAGNPSQSFSTGGTAPFDSTASVVDNLGGGFATQHQASTLTATLMRIAGDFDGVRPAFAGTGTASGTSSADIVFTTTVDEELQLNATAHVFDSPQGFGPSVSRTISLTGPGVNVSWFVSSLTNFLTGQPYWTGDRSATVDLLAGQSYELKVILGSQVGPNFPAPGGPPLSADVSSFIVELGVPEPALGSLAIVPLLIWRRRRR